MAKRVSIRRTLAWTVAMRDLHRERVASAPGPSPLYLRSLERARAAEVQRQMFREAIQSVENARKAQEQEEGRS